ncbi:hypothetical protein [Streptomyces scabiei]|uniref:Integrase n=1 Tax=Streptomyces scabiei TaxID=1930 RepID=A0A117EGU2_STRSC|nr:hypothetical protein [Streptomyces scabiei]GAQ67687.1 hypothetical protein SsS58_08143 [Streptomyces scabiei]
MKELAGDGVHVTVACRVLKLARQPYYRWLDRPVNDAMLEEAYRANALFDAHRDDPEFGYRFLADEARGVGTVMADRTAWRICRDNRWWSVFGTMASPQVRILLYSNPSNRPRPTPALTTLPAACMTSNDRSLQSYGSDAAFPHASPGRISSECLTA